MFCFSLCLYFFGFILTCVHGTRSHYENCSSLTGRQLLVHTKASRNQITGGTHSKFIRRLFQQTHGTRATPNLFASPLANFHFILLSFDAHYWKCLRIFLPLCIFDFRRACATIGMNKRNVIITRHNNNNNDHHCRLNIETRNDMRNTVLRRPNIHKI